MYITVKNTGLWWFVFASNQDLRSFFSISSLLHSRYLFGDLLQLFLSDMFPNLHMVLLCLFWLTEQVTRIYSFILGNGVENSVCANLTSSKGDQSEGRNRQEIALNCLIEHDPYHGGGGRGWGLWLGCARSREFLRHRLHLWKHSRRTLNANKVTLMK